jgi:hypothetical protein
MSTEYKYEFSDFLNDTCDAQKLQLQIQGSSITTTVEGVTVKYTVEETCIDFVSDLSGADKTTLDQIVAAHDGIPIIEMGDAWAESDSESGTTSIDWQEKLHIDFNCTNDGNDYKIYWYAEIGSSDDKVVNAYRVKLYNSPIQSRSDEGTILMEITRAFQKKVSDGQWESMTGWKYLPLDVGNYTIAFEYSNTNNRTTYIRNARLHVEEE